jgi:hypothetical protein
MIVFILLSPLLAVITAVTTWIALVGSESKTILQVGGSGDGVATITRIEADAKNSFGAATGTPRSGFGNPR